MAIAPGTASARQGAIFWANANSESGGSIGTAGIDGSEPDQDFVSAASYPKGLAVNGTHVYWANSSAGGDATIGRVALDGSELDRGFIDAPAATSVAVDDRYVYWAHLQTIGRARLDGSEVDPSFLQPGPEEIQTIAVAGGYIYWAASSHHAGQIGRARTDGTETTILVPGLEDEADGLAVDDRYVYWGGFGAVSRARLDGSGVDSEFISTPSWVGGIAVDDDHIYWANNAGNSGTTIGRADLDGHGVTQDFISGAAGPWGVAVLPARGAAALSASSLEFGSQGVGAAGPEKTVTVTNSGPARLDIGRVGVAGGDADDFLIAADGCGATSLQPGASCALRLRFAPEAPGPRETALVIASDDPAGPARVALSGNGVAAPAAPALLPTQLPTPLQEAAKPAGTRVLNCVVRRAQPARCTSRIVARPFRIAPGGRSAPAVLRRGGAVYASGTALLGKRRFGLVLARAWRELEPGRYQLQLKLGGKPATRLIVLR